MERKGPARLAALSATCAMALLVGDTGAAFAQEALEEIIVTASKRRQSLSEVPQAIQALTGATLEETGRTDLVDLVSLIPGANVVSSNAPGFQTISIRGVATNTVGDSTVGYYIDELAFGTPNLQLAPPANLFDLERVEVLRGPSGTLYGQGSMGGTIKLITAAPDATKTAFKGRLDVGDIAHGGWRKGVDGALNLPLMEDKLAVRLVGSFRDTDGFAESPEFPGEEDINDSKERNLRGKVRFTPTEALRIDLGYWNIATDQDFNNTLTTVDPPVAANLNGVRGFVDVDADIYTGALSWDLGFASFEAGTSYLEHTLDLLTGIAVPLVPGVNLGVTNDSTFDTESFSQEVRLVSQGDGPLRWIVGGFYQDATIDSTIDLASSLFLPGPTGAPGFVLPPDATTLTLSPKSAGPLDSESWSVYGEVSYDLLDGTLTPLVGLRYFRDKRSASGIATDVTTGFLPAPFAIKDTFDSVNPRFNLTWKPSDGTMLYANVAKGFRSGSIQTPSQVFAAGISPGFAPPGVRTSAIIKPDDLWTYEAGTKLELAGGTVAVEAAAYYTDWTDVQTSFTSVLLVPSQLNAGDASIRGLELSVAWRTPIDGLRLDASASLNESEWESVQPDLTAVVPAFAKGRRLPGSPKTTFQAAASYTRPVSEALSLQLDASYAYRGDVLEASTGLKSDEINNVSLRAGLVADNWAVTLYVENALDEDGPNAIASAITVQPVFPRVIGVQLRTEF